MLSIVIFALVLRACGGQVAVKARSLGVAVPWLCPGEELRRTGLVYEAMVLIVGIIAASSHSWVKKNLEMA
jgi:hypothetical protein